MYYNIGFTHSRSPLAAEKLGHVSAEDLFNPDSAKTKKLDVRL
jgi:hypothetical protein